MWLKIFGVLKLTHPAHCLNDKEPFSMGISFHTVVGTEIGQNTVQFWNNSQLLAFLGFLSRLIFIGMMTIQ